MAVFDTPLTTTDQSLERVLAAGLPVALLFFNGSPDPEIFQSMQRLARAHAGNLLLVKLQASENPESTRRFQVHQLPALVTVRHGKELSRAELVNIEALEKHIAFLMGQGPHPGTQTNGSRQASPVDAGRSSGGTPLTVTDRTFDDLVLRAPVPVLVDFWAPWCGPCRMTEPAVERLAHENPARLRVAKVNVDENPALSGRFGVQSIPTMMVVKDGRVVDRWSGALPEPQLRSRLAGYTGH